MNNREFFLWWKRYGETLAETRERFLLFHPELSGENIRYEGRLDPLAEGIILFLPAKNEQLIQSLRKERKQYSCDFLLGIGTDSFDILGMPKYDENSSWSIQRLESSLEEGMKTISGCREMEIPRYSSRFVKRILRGEDIPREKKEMCFSQVSLEKIQFISPDELREKILGAIRLVRGEYRQEEIMQAWISLFHNLRSDIRFPILRLSLHASSGSYVRSFIHELGKSIGSSASSLKITRNGFANFFFHGESEMEGNL